MLTTKMQVLTRLFVCFCFVTVGISAQVFAQDDAPEYRSLRNNLIQNADLFQRFDVLIEHSYFVGKGHEGVGVKSLDRRIRLAVDFQENRIFCFGQVTKDSTVLNETGKGDAKTIREEKIGAHLVVAEDARGFFAAFPGRKSEMRRKGRGMCHYLSRLDVPDIRCIGFSKFPVYFKDNGFFDRVVANEGLPVASDLRTKEFVSRVNGKINIEVVPETDGGSGIVWSEVYNSETLTPENSVVSQISGSDRRVLLEALYSWKEHEGFQLPTSCTTEEIQYDEMGKVRLSEYQTFDIHWLSIGKPLDSNLFDTLLHDDLRALMKLIDSEAVLATTPEIGR